MDCRPILLLIGLSLLGCPGKKDPAVDPTATVTQSPTPTPASSPPGAEAAWANLIKHARDHPRAVTGRLKQKDQREALLKPFEAPTPQTLRLITLTKWLLVFDPTLKRPTALIRPLRLHLQKQGQLDPSVFRPDAPQTVGILVLQDPAFLYDRQILGTAKGWLSMRRALQRQAFDPRVATAILKGVQQARAGKWDEAEKILGPAFLALGKRNTIWLGDVDATASWSEVESLYAQKADPGALEQALRAWALRFQKKPGKLPNKGPVKKPGTKPPPRSPGKGK